MPAAHLWKHLPPGARAIRQGDDVKDWLELGGDPARLLEICHEIPTARSLSECDAGEDTELPPPRGWLLGSVFARCFLSALLADGATGKTALRYVQYLSLAIGRSLTGEHVFERCRVLIVSLEDDIKELRRRILAARLHHKIDLDEVRGRLFYAAPGRAAGKLLELDKKGRTLRGELASTIEQVIVKRKIDLVALDPFVKTHSVEENSNSAIDDVVQILTDLAAEYDLAVDTSHHTAKGMVAEPGNANRGRGATAMKDGSRLIYTLTTMSSQEANAFGIPEQERHQFIRMDSAKVNIARHMSQAKWFRLIGVAIGNATELYPHGDEVQTVEVWTPPDAWADLSADIVASILTTIEDGLSDGNRYTDAGSATKRAAWKVVVKHAPDKSEAQAREVIKTWVKNGVLVRYEYDNPVDRKRAEGLRVDPEKRSA